MSGDRYVGFYPGKWRNSLARLSLAAEGLMIRICAYRWDANRNVPSDPVEGGRLLGVNHNQFRKYLEELVNAGEVRIEGGLILSDRAEASHEQAAKAIAKAAPRRDMDQGCEREAGDDTIVTEAVTHPGHPPQSPTPVTHRVEAEKIEQILRAPAHVFRQDKTIQESTPVVPMAGDVSAFDVQQAFDLWNATALSCGLPQAKLTPDRRKKIAARMREHDGLDSWRTAMAAIDRSSFLTGGQPGRNGGESFRASLDFVCQKSTFVKLIEGTYGNGRHAAAKAKPKQPAYLSRY